MTEQILLAYIFPKEIVTAIMMLSKNTKSMVRSPDGDANSFKIVNGDITAPYLFMLWLNYQFRNSVEI